MTRIISYTILLAFFVTIQTPTVFADSLLPKVYPSATEQMEFELQVESLLRATEARGHGFGGPDDRELENRVRKDARDWESALAKILNDYAKYGFHLGEEAISVVKIRGTFHNDEIVTSCGMFFEEVVKDEISKIAEFESRGEKVPYWVGRVDSILSQLLDFHDPRILRMVLRHLGSNKALKMDRCNKVMLEEIPKELRACGDATRNRDEAE